MDSLKETTIPIEKSNNIVTDTNNTATDRHHCSQTKERKPHTDNIATYKNNTVTDNTATQNKRQQPQAD